MPRWWVFFAVGLLLGACSTARDRAGSTSLLDSMGEKRSATLEHLSQSNKTGTIYLDYSTALVADGLFLDLTYRKLYLDELAEAYMLPSNQQVARWQRAKQDYRNFFEFVLVLYSGSADPPKFGRPGSAWQVVLKDDEGDVLRPVGVKQLSHQSKPYRFLKKYFKPVDRWAEVYLVRFAKLDRPAPKGDHPFELILTGLEGRTLLRWEDRGLFYQKDEPNTGL